MIQKTHNKNTRATAALLALLAGAPGAALACGDSPYVGTICTFAFNYCPEGFLAADGSLVPLMSNQVLFSLLGTTFGGDGRTNFGLPDLRGRIPVGTGASPGLTPVVWGQKRGAEGVTLSTSQMATHTHPAVLTGTGGGSATASGNVNLPVSGSTASAAVTGTVSANVLTSQTSGASATPSASVNTVGKNGLQATFYPYAAGAALTSPSTVNLTAPSAAVSGSATGNVSLPVSGTVTVGNNTPPTTPVPVLNPGLGMTVCIVAQGLYPSRPY